MELTGASDIEAGQLQGGRVGVIVANTGSPADPSPREVGRYLKQFLGNPRIVPMNRIAWSIILNLFVVPARSKKSAQKYAGIWTDGGFQFIRDHEEIARKLQALYRADGVDVRVECAMSFGEPSIERAVRLLRDDGCERVTVLPLYPQNAYSQASIVADEVARVADLLGCSDCITVVGDYSANDMYLQAIADSIAASGFDGEPDKLLLSFHSIPRIDVQNGDTYEQAVHATCQAVTDLLQLPQDSWATGFQSRFDKEREWVSPFSADVLRAWVRDGFAGRLFVVCPNFSVDCLETYYDIEQEMRSFWLQLLEEAGAPGDEGSFVYIPCLGAADRHVRVIRDVIDRASE